MRPAAAECGFIRIYFCDVHRFSRRVSRRRLVCHCIFVVPRGQAGRPVPTQSKILSALKGPFDVLCNAVPVRDPTRHGIDRFAGKGLFDAVFRVVLGV